MRFLLTPVRGRFSRARLAVLAGAAAATLLAFPANASALTWSGPLAVTSFAVSPTPATPGSNATVTTAFTLDGDKNNVPDLATVTWPTGMKVNDGAADTCSLAQFDATPPTCPAGSDVGSATAVSYHESSAHPATSWSGDVFQLPGSPLQLGFALTDNTRFVHLVDTVQSGAARVHVIAESGSSSLPIPFTTGSPASKVLRELSFTLNATTPSGVWFVRNPTSCPPWVSSLEVSNKPDPAATATASFGAGPCAPPDTFIIDGPPAGGVNHDPTFTFSSDDPGATFECHVDAMTWHDCSAIYTIHLSDGMHTICARAKNAYGTDPTPVCTTFRIDMHPPVVTITAPATGSSFAAGSSVTAAFTYTDSGGSYPLAITCVLSGSNGYSATIPGCVSPTTFSLLPAGTYTLTVTAVDTVGNVGSTSSIFVVT